MRREDTMADLFATPRALVGVVHVRALPGTPKSDLGIERIVEEAVADAHAYKAAGFDGLMIENMHDRPYLRRGVGPEIVAAMTAVGREVRSAVGLPLGVQILAGANREAMAVALACGASFARVEGFVFAHVADEGVIQSDAAELLRYRREIGAQGVRVIADIKKKHSSHAITADVDLVETAKAAEFFLADAVVVTGTSTGHSTDPDEVRAVSEAVDLPVAVGCGVSPENMAAYGAADILIVGSAAKQGGTWSEPVAPERARALTEAFRRAAGG